MNVLGNIIIFISSAFGERFEILFCWNFPPNKVSVVSQQSPFEEIIVSVIPLV